LIAAVQGMEPALGDDPFLGHGKITVTDMQVSTASINAVPDECTIFLDRRLTFGESKEEALAQVQRQVPPGSAITVEMLRYAEPSYTGFVFPVEKYFPAWALAEDHPLVQAGLTVRRAIGLPDDPPGKWDFSTNGVYWMGTAGIPSIGFGPGDEVHAHTVRDQVALADVVQATAFYALLPAALK
jgi:putative selenium metabolism hydrolase